MSADNRKVSTDALETLGTIIGPDEKRDAIHLAVIPVQAKHSLRPGENVQADGRTGPNPVGIVDPFIKTTIRTGDWFWLVIYPRQITSLRHVWSHPAFPNEPGEPEPEFCKEFSEVWLKGWLSRSDNGGLTYEELLELGRTGSVSSLANDFGYENNWRIDGPYVFSYGLSASGEIPAEVWDHVENVIGQKVAERPTYFSCTC